MTNHDKSNHDDYKAIFSENLRENLHYQIQFAAGGKLNKMHGFRTPLNFPAHLSLKNSQSRKKSRAKHN